MQTMSLHPRQFNAFPSYDASVAHPQRRLVSERIIPEVGPFRRDYFGGTYGSGVPSLIGGYFFRLSSNSVTIFTTGSMTHE